MPYSGPDDKTLPSNVQELPIALRKQWVAVWNDTYANCKNPKIGGGAGTNCETVAFRMANGVIKKRTKEIGVMFDDDTKEGRMISTANAAKMQTALQQLLDILKAAGVVDSETKEVGEKQCIDCGTAVDYRAYGGATRFAEIDAFMEAQDKAGQIEDQTYQFQELIRNIMANSDIGFEEKAAAIAAAAQELPARVANPPKPPWRKELVGKALRAVGLKAVTKTEGSDSFPAGAYAYVPDPEKPSTWKLRLEETPGKLTVAQIGRAITALQPGGFRGQKVDIPAGDKAGIISKINTAIGKVTADDEQKTNLRDRLDAVKEVGSAFTLTKDASGRLRYVTVTSNRYYDRDGEVFPEQVHKEAVAYADGKKQYPELWLWHMPGTRMGQGDMADYFDGFRLDSGLIDKGMESIAMKVASLPDLGVSHGFSFVKEADTYREYRSKEVSILPREHAANPWTGVILESEDKSMGFTDEKRKFLVDAGIAEEKITQIEEAVGLLKESAEGAGVAFKEMLPDEVVEEVAGTAGVEKLLADLTTAVQGVAGQVTTVQETVTGLQATVDQHGEAIKELKESDDAKIASALRTKTAALKPADSPANKDDNTISEEDARKQGAGEPPESPTAPFVKQANKVLGLAEG